jgi:hypothetical protein
LTKDNIINKKKENNMNETNWFKKHIDTIIILGAFASSVLWMNGKFNEIEKEIAIIKTVLIMKNIMPSDLAKSPNTTQ